MGRARVGRALLVGLFVGGAIALPVASVQADTGCPPSTAALVVHLPNGDQTLTAADLCSIASVDTQYYTRATSKAPQQADPFISAGVPVTDVLQDVGLDPSTVQFTGAVRTTDGSWSTLSHADLVNPTFESGLVPVVQVDGDSMYYVRPLRNDPTDTNARDEIEMQPGVPLQLYAGTGPMLDVTATATPTKAKPGQAISFAASSSPASESPSYSWTFSDGGTAFGARVTHAFAAAGTYQVSVVASGGDGSGGEASIFATVGSSTPSPSSTPTPDGGSSPPTSPTPGPPAGAGNQPSATPSPSATIGFAAPQAPGQPGPSTSLPPLGRVNLPRSELDAPGSAPLVATGNLPLVRGRLISNGAVVLTGGAAAALEAGASPAGRRSAAWRAAGLVGSVATIMLLFAAGAARELQWPKRSMTRARSVVRPR